MADNGMDSRHKAPRAEADYGNDEIPDNYISRKSTFLATYDHIILPNNGPKLWPVVDVEPINPPYTRRAPGRPKKQRRRANDEPKNPHRLRRQQATVRCRRCGTLGHSSRSCRGKTAADRVILVGGNRTHTQVQQPENGGSLAQSEVHQASQVESQGEGRQTSDVRTRKGSKRKEREAMATQESQTC